MEASHLLRKERDRLIAEDGNRDAGADRPAGHGITSGQSHQQTSATIFYCIEIEVDVAALIDLRRDRAYGRDGIALGSNAKLLRPQKQVDLGAGRALRQRLRRHRYSR